MLKFSFTLPSWLHWLVPSWLKQEHDQRLGLTGKVSTSFLNGVVTMTSEKRP